MTLRKVLDKEKNLESWFPTLKPGIKVEKLTGRPIFIGVMDANFDKTFAYHKSIVGKEFSNEYGPYIIAATRRISSNFYIVAQVESLAWGDIGFRFTGYERGNGKEKYPGYACAWGYMRKE